MKKIFILAGLVLFLWGENVLAAAYVPPVVDGSMEFHGELTTGDRYWEIHWGLEKSYYDNVPFTVATDGLYTIEVTQANLTDNDNNTKLFLFADALGSDTMIKWDDDSGSGFLSMIEVQLNKDTDYYFSLGTALSETLGTWTVKIEAVNSPVPSAILLMGSGLVCLAGFRRKD